MRRLRARVEAYCKLSVGTGRTLRTGAARGVARSAVRWRGRVAAVRLTESFANERQLARRPRAGADCGPRRHNPQGRMKEEVASTSSLSEDLRLLIWSYRGDSLLEEPPADASGVVVVLGTQVLPGGRPSKPLYARARHAARLYTKGEATLVIPTGGVGKHPPSEAEVM